MPKRNTVADFWSRVQILGPDECWPWISTSHINGYGQFSLDGKNRLASNWAFRLYYDIDVIEAGQVVMHTCDNPPCCNPAHLRLGTYGNNQQDSYDKGRRANRAKGARHGRHTMPERTARGERNGKHTKPERTPRGENQGLAKLTNEIVRSIRHRPENNSVLAREFGVAVNTVWNIRNGRTWRHLSD